MASFRQQARKVPARFRFYAVSVFTSQFHTRLRERRKESGLSQKQAAEACGIGPDRWSQLERGRRTPNERELTAIQVYFRLGWVFIPPRKATKRLLDNGARLTPVEKPFSVPQDRATRIRYRKLLARHGDMVRALEDKLRRRADFSLCQAFCHQVRCDSYLEALYLMCRLVEGAVPSFLEPVRFGLTPLPIVDPQTREYVGARPHLCLIDKGSYEFFQVSFFGAVVHRVDVLRWSDQWQVLELDGEGHSSEDDSERQHAIALPTTRMRPAELVSMGWELLQRVA